MAKENRKNIPEEKKDQRNRYDTSADNILEDQPEGRHFNEDVEPRQPRSSDEKNPNAHLGAQDLDDDETAKAQGKHVTTAITAPEITEEKSQVEEETLAEIKKDMTGG